MHHLAIVLAGSAALLIAAAQSTTPVPPAAAPAVDRLSKLHQAVAHPQRTAANIARDRYRHPAQTLDFFEVDPTDTVVELWPGGGWYTEILAPYLAAGGGRLYLAARTGAEPASAS